MFEPFDHVRDLEHPQHCRRRSLEEKASLLLAQSLRCGNDDAKAARVEEVDAFEVKGDQSSSTADNVAEHFFELSRGLHVHDAAGDNGPGPHRFGDLDV